MKRKAIIAASIFCFGVGPASAQPVEPIAGRTTLGISVVEMSAVVLGWSAKKSLLGKTVLNSNKEKIGKIDDLIITPKTADKVPYASFAIVGTGGFLGIGKHDVVIPMEQFQLQNGELVLPNATKDALKALPEFEYARNETKK